MKRELARAFPTVPYWEAGREEDLATLSGVFGAYVVSHAFGIPLLYAPDRWPALDPCRRLTMREAERLEAEQVLQSPVVEDLFRQMEVIERERLQARQRASGFPIDKLSVSNCVMNMISPQAYAEFIRPWDRRIAESFERFGVHTFNWNITPYIEVLAPCPSWATWTWASRATCPESGLPSLIPTGPCSTRR